MKSFLTLLLLAFSLHVNAVQFTWDTPTQREGDRSLDPNDIKEYVIYDVTNGGRDEIARTKENRYDHDLPKAGYYEFVITTLDTDNVESLNSNIASKDTNRIKPLNIKIVVVVTIE